MFSFLYVSQKVVTPANFPRWSDGTMAVSIDLLADRMACVQEGGSCGKAGRLRTSFSLLVRGRS